MADSLEGLAVLIVEDEFYLADDLASALGEAGARVLGPFGRVEDAQRLIESGQAVDIAILDIDLVGDRVFPVADMLRERGTPFLFATGYDPDIIPSRLSDVPRLEKPVTTAAVVRLLLVLHLSR
ncbi:response regulator [Caulobacter endophyticus]|uniref:Response regulator n=1 Tax=Caulobacter endophyticus TaxID=2172652 RepID=A0A2T9JH08_9CAUL|nr:response regulator [Caulobacter endophyticus]PVM82959.1 response regulator [Caulobacter endophyticus]